MLISQSLQSSSATTADVPKPLMTDMLVGQRVDALVLSSALKSELVKLKVNDTIMQLRSPIALQQGQQLQLELVKEGESTVLKLTLVNQNGTTAPLKIGHQAAVEVIKLLGQQRMLAEVRLPDINGKPQPAQQIEIDTSALKQTFKPGDRLLMEILSDKPLSVRLQPQVRTTPEMLTQQQQRLLPLIDIGNTRLEQLVTAQSDSRLPQGVRSELQQLIQHVAERSALQRPAELKQAIVNSGVFMEQQLVKQGQVPTADFKANLLKLAAVLEQQIVQHKLPIITNEQAIKSLPADVQKALNEFLSMPQQLNRLPAQIQTALSATGKTPAQLLMMLLSGQWRSASVANPTVTEPLLQTALSQTPTGKSAPSTTHMQNQARLASLEVLKGLLREVESVSSRLQLNQLTMLKEGEATSNSSVWLFDLPVKDKQQLEMMQMRIEQQHAQHNEDEDIWQVTLNLETQNLGPMQANISMHMEQVNVVLIAEHESSAELLQTHIEWLNERLAASGAQVGQLVCRCAPVEPLIAASSADIAKSAALVDVSV